ncbi:MAG: PAS domain S-box protein [Desulfuromonadales bacterium]|nr:PAS domain S-box protein [Desulfuromonadales bacterium]
MGKKTFQPIDNHDLRRWAEESLEAKVDSAHPGGPVEEQLRLLHELQVHKIELEMQNAELHLAIDEWNKTERLLGKFTDLYDFAPVGYLVLTRKGEIISLNFTCANFIGIERSELVHRQFHTLFSENDFPLINTFLDSVFESPDKKSCEASLLKKGDLPLFVRMEATTTETGNECRLVLIDITKRKQAEELLKNSEDQYRTILHTLLDGFWVVDMQGRFIDVNESYCNLIGYNRNELRGMSIQNVEAIEDKNEIENHIQQIISQGSHRFESQHRCKNGHIVDLEICVSKIPNTDRLCASLRDITNRNRTEQALKSVSNYTRSLIEASLDPLVAISTDGRITDVNEASVEVTGVPKEQLIGSDYSLYFTEPENVKKGIRQALSEGALRDYPLTIRHVSGRLTDVLCNASYYKDERGNTQGLFAAARDVTEFKKAQELLKKAHEELESRVAERTASLALANEQMKKTSFALVRAEEHERERIARELHDQVGQSLLLAKMKLDALADRLAADPLCSLAEEVSTLIESTIHDIRSLTFRTRPPILDTSGIVTALEWLCSSISSDYHLQVDFSSDCQPKPLSVELRYSLYQAVRELLLNVVKHAKVERAQLSIECDPHTFIVHVIDQGVGFDHPDALMKHITRGSYGLYNVQQRIEQMGGRFAIESTPGRGTSVTLMVPFSERESDRGSNENNHPACG